MAFVISGYPTNKLVGFTNFIRPNPKDQTDDWTYFFLLFKIYNNKKSIRYFFFKYRSLNLREAILDILKTCNF